MTCGVGGKDHEKKPNHPASLVMVRVGGHDLPQRSEARCHTCQHPNRLEIETLLVQGYAYRKVAEQVSEASGKPISWWSIRDHYKAEHLPLNTAALRRLSENRTRELGAALDEAADQIVDHVVVAKAILQVGYQRLASGEAVPDVKETLAAAKLVKEIEEAAAGALDTQAWSDAFVQFFETARSVMSPEQYAEFGHRLATNPVLQAIEAKSQPEPIDTVAVDDPPMSA